MNKRMKAIFFVDEQDGIPICPDCKVQIGEGEDHCINCALYEAEFEIEGLRGEIEHANSFDSTASHFDHCEDRSWGSLTDEQRQYWIERARQEDDVPIGSLRVWNVINPPCEPVWHPVETPEEGARLIDQLANEQVNDPLIFVNAFGLCEWDGEEWTEWYDDIGNEVDSILKDNAGFTAT